MREPGSLRPTHQGSALAKDMWLTGIGASLLVDGLTDAGGVPNDQQEHPTIA